MIDKQLLASAIRLRSPELTPFVEWLRLERHAVLEHLAVAPDMHTKQLQGEAARLKKILELIDTAPAVLEKMEG